FATTFRKRSDAPAEIATGLVQRTAHCRSRFVLRVARHLRRRKVCCVGPAGGQWTLQRGSGAVGGSGTVPYDATAGNGTLHGLPGWQRLHHEYARNGARRTGPELLGRGDQAVGRTAGMSAVVHAERQLSAPAAGLIGLLRRNRRLLLGAAGMLLFVLAW